MGMCKVKLEHNNQDKICNFFVFPRYGQALEGMADKIKINITTMNCNTIDTQETNRADKCNTNTANCQDSRC